MTCIAGIVHHNQVYIGGDSAGIGGYTVTLRSDAKVFRNGAFLIGYTTSFRMGQLLRYSFVPPVRGMGIEPFRYMTTTFVDAVRDCFRIGGYTRRESDQESGGCFMVGYEGRLFTIEDDFQVGEQAIGYHAIGSGDRVALGALFATHDLAPRERIHTALSAAEVFTSGVCGPFVIEQL